MKRFIIYFVILVIALFGFRKFHYSNLLSVNYGFYGKYTTIFNKSNNFDVLFLGSSRAQMHYNTKLYDECKKSNSFNLSYNGANVQQAYTLLKCYLIKSNAPKKLYYEIDYHVLKTHEDGWMDFQNLFPYLSNNQIYNMLNKIDNRFFYAKYFPFYSLPNSGIKNYSTSAHYFLHKSIQTDSLFYKGYFKNNVQQGLLNFPNQLKYQWINGIDRNYLDSIIVLCNQKNIKLSFITSPIFGGGKLDVINHKQLINYLNQIAFINNISYINLSSLSFCNDRSLFVDQHHMNEKGSNLFTHYFCEIVN